MISEWLPDNAAATFNGCLLAAGAVHILAGLGVDPLHTLGLLIAWLLVYVILFVALEYDS